MRFDIYQYLFLVKPFLPPSVVDVPGLVCTKREVRGLPKKLQNRVTRAITGRENEHSESALALNEFE